MSKADWSLAPEGATHYNTANQMFYRFGLDRGYVFHKSHNAWNLASCQHEYGSLIIERPQQPKPWSGPEDGLPPVEWCSVGKMVQVMSLPTLHHEDVSIYLSKPSKIVASYTGDDGDTFLMLRIDCDFGTGYECFAAHRVLPAKTENQLAAEKRETAIRELMDIAQVDCRVTAARLVDAGFKREVV